MGSKQVRRAATLLRLVNPESFRAAEQAKRICDQAWGIRADEPSVEAVVRGFTGLLRYGPMLGPGMQETLRSNLDRLIERMELTCEVNRDQPSAASSAWMASALAHPCLCQERGRRHA